MDTACQRRWNHQIARLSRIINVYAAGEQPIKLSRCWLMLHRLAAMGMRDAAYEMGLVHQRMLACDRLYAANPN